MLTLLDGFLFGAGTVLLVGGLTVWRYERRRPRRFARRRWSRSTDASVVIDGFTVPSASVAALCAQPLPSEANQ